MFVKKSTLALCSSSNLPTFVWPFATLTSCHHPRPRSFETPGPRPPTRQGGTRRYATTNNGPKWSSEPAVSSHDWPASPNPTPYQIFDQQRTAPYSKARFYQLVKIYHPDRHRHIPGDTLAHDARLERYRLVVAANEILSDPHRRRAYDLYGAGWAHVLSMDNSALRHADRSWRNEPGNPSMNATWEDWERWYEQRAGNGQKQRTVFMSNELFVVVLCAFVLVGSIGQAKRATTSTMNVVEMQEQRHEAISHDMTQRRMQQGGLSRHERVESFLKQREGWDYAATTSPRKHDGEGK
jgi:hypothetical protein